MKQINHFFYHAFYLQTRSTQQIMATLAYTIQLGQEVHSQSMRITNLAVSFMNTADVTVVVTVLANFQIQIVLDL